MQRAVRQGRQGRGNTGQQVDPLAVDEGPDVLGDGAIAHAEQGGEHQGGAHRQACQQRVDGAADVEQRQPGENPVAFPDVEAGCRHQGARGHVAPRQPGQFRQPRGTAGVDQRADAVRGRLVQRDAGGRPRPAGAGRQLDLQDPHGAALEGPL
ncbi:hypothetical protein FQZ97_1110900 [compost metagenome]